MAKHYRVGRIASACSELDAHGVQNAIYKHFILVGKTYGLSTDATI